MEDEAFDILRNFVMDVEAAYGDSPHDSLGDVENGDWPDLYITYVNAKRVLATRDRINGIEK